MQLIAIAEWALRRKYLLSDAFKFFRWECFPKNGKRVIYYELEGGVPQANFKSGPRKGSPNYSTCTDQMTFQVTDLEMEQHERDYIEATGNCSDCMGKGETLSSYSVANGATYRKCSQCNGNGKSQQHQSVARCD